jgi:hypothetical protein
MVAVRRLDQLEKARGAVEWRILHQRQNSTRTGGEMMADEPKKPQGPIKRRGPAPDTMTIPGQKGRNTRNKMKKAQPGPIQKPGRRRP